MLKNPFTFDESGFQFQEEQEGVLIWLTPNGDKLALFYFEIAPDIEADLEDNESLRAFYRANAHRAGLGVLEIETIVVDSLLAVRTLFKMAQGRWGRKYIGALTFPCRDFSYVLRVESPELGLSGTRETCVTAKLLATQEMPGDFPVTGKGKSKSKTPLIHPIPNPINPSPSPAPPRLLPQNWTWLS